MTPPRDCAPLLEARDLDEMAEWAAKRPVRHGWKGRTCRELWDAAPRGDWLLYYAAAAGADSRDLVRAAAACVRPALRFVQEGEDRPRLAIEAAERWADGPTEENRRRAMKAGDAAAGAGDAVAMDAMEASWAARATAWAARVAGGWDADLVGEAAAAAARARRLAKGSKSAAAARRACVAEVRRLVPFLDLSIGGAR